MCKKAINEIGNYAYLQTEITFPLWFQAQYISGETGNNHENNEARAWY
jgi:hypothetical protein